MDFAVRANRATKARRDFVILQIDVRAARWTNRRAGRGTDLLFRFAFETFDQRAALPSPETFDFSKNRNLSRWRA